MNPPLPPFLQELFDRGADPLDDPAACAWLEQHPEHLDAFAALRADLRAVADVPPGTTWPARRWPLLPVAVAAAGLLAMLAWWTRSPAPASTVLPRPALAPRSLVLAIRTQERIADDTRAFAFATVQGTLTRQASATYSTFPTGRHGGAAYLCTTIHAETILP